MTDWITNSLDWMPLIGGWSFAAQVTVVWVLLLIALLAVEIAADGTQGKRVRRSFERIGFGIVLVGALSILPVGLATVAAVVPGPYPPVPSSTAPIAGAEDMDTERIEVRGDDRNATLILYGEREDDAFRVQGYRVRIVGSEITTAADWKLALPSSWRYRGYGITSEPIRSDGEWQWGQVSQEGIFSSGQSYEFSFDFNTRRYGEEVEFPISF